MAQKRPTAERVVTDPAGEFGIDVATLRTFAERNRIDLGAADGGAAYLDPRTARYVVIPPPAGRSRTRPSQCSWSPANGTDC